MSWLECRSGGANNETASPSSFPAPEFPLDTGRTPNVKPPKSRQRARSSLGGRFVPPPAPDTEAGEADFELEVDQDLDRISGLNSQDTASGLKAPSPISENIGPSPPADENVPLGAQSSGGRIKPSKRRSPDIPYLFAPGSEEIEPQGIGSLDETGGNDEGNGGEEEEEGFFVTETLRFISDDSSGDTFDESSPGVASDVKGGFVPHPETEGHEDEGQDGGVIHEGNEGCVLEEESLFFSQIFSWLPLPIPAGPKWINDDLVFSFSCFVCVFYAQLSVSPSF